MRICPQCAQRTEARICEADGFQTVDEASLRSDRDPWIGRIFEERYRIEGVLGRGGMGTVYRATQLSVGRPVALKVLNASLVSDLTTIARFQQEARSVAALRHPNTIRLIDFGQSEDRTLFLVMEFLEGEPLSALIKREAPLDPERIIRFGVQALESLAEAHSVGIVHRDLKPDNLFVTELFGRPDFLKVLDFGIAKVSGFGKETNLTGDGVALGTPRYIAPEQASAEKVDARADIYSLCALLYEMLTGKPPFVCGSVVEYMVAHLESEVPTIQREGQVLTGRLPELIYDGLAKLPEHRPASALVALERLRACAGSPFEALSPMRPSGGVSTLTTRALPRIQRSEARSLELSALSDAGGDALRQGESPGEPRRVERRSANPPVATPPHASLTGLSQRGGAGELGAPEGATPAAPARIALAALVLFSLGGGSAWWYMQGGESASKVAIEPTPVARAVDPVESAGAEPQQARELPVKSGPSDDSGEPARAQDGVVMLKTIPAGATVKRGGVLLGVTPLALMWSDEQDTRSLLIKLEGYRSERLRRSDVGESRSFELYLRPRGVGAHSRKGSSPPRRGDPKAKADGWITTLSAKRPPAPKPSEPPVKAQPYEELD